MIKKTVVAAIFTALTAVAALAGQPDPKSPEAAEKLLKKSMQDVLEALEHPDLSDDARQEAIEAIVDPVFNYGLIARLSMGRTNWQKLDREQRRLFVERFVSRLKDSYFENIAMVQGGTETTIDYGKPEMENNRVHIPVAARMDDSSVDMRYKFHYSEDAGWRVYDVEINGVSIVSSYRSQFSQVLADKSVEELLEALKTLEAPPVE